MVTVYVRGSSVNLDPKNAIGKGGEADIYRVGTETLKLYKSATHPDLAGFPQQQQAARERLALAQHKLPVFPKGLPAQVISPKDLVTDKSGRQILGFTMPLVDGAEVLLRYGQKQFRQNGVTNQIVTEIFKNLHPLVSGIHQAGVEIGDFNDLNVLIKGTQGYLIDADSFQYGGFYCQVFTDRFVDPLLIREFTKKERSQSPNLGHFTLAKPFNKDSDWYAFAVMLMQSLLFVGPYGGVYKPKNHASRIPDEARPLQRITVFNPEVMYPKPATPYMVLSDDLLHYFTKTFVEDKRGEFPLSLLGNLHWSVCPSCGLAHSRRVCPICAVAASGVTLPLEVIRGTVTSTLVFETRGLILYATVQGGKLRYLYHENSQFKREDRSIVLTGNIDPQIRYRIRGNDTLLGKGDRLVTFDPNLQPASIFIDTYRNLSVFDANSDSRFLLQNGRLVRDGSFGGFDQIGEILSGQTLFWVGPEFGFGFYRAGTYSVAFVFDAKRTGINDSVKLPVLSGQLVDSTCVFGKDRCYFFISVHEGSRIINRVFLIRASGAVEATAEAEDGDGSWLGTIRGKTAAGDFILAATDEGVMRIEAENGQLVIRRQFPDTEPFVDAGSYLHIAAEGLYVVGSRQIRLLKIN